MNRIEKKFKELKRRKKKAFIAFVTCGYPNLNTTEKLVLEFEKKGVDIVELGVPFSDPLADGPIIQESSQVALRKNVHLRDILRLVKRLRNKTEIPLCLMTYFNPIFCFPEEKFIRQARASGVDGLIIPDLPPEEGKSFMRSANKSGLDTICFLSPTSTLKRAKYISSVSSGFIYYVSLTGTTGIRKGLSSDLKKNLNMIKKKTSKPVCVGFGISSPAQVKQINRIADGVIVGSAIIKKIKENIKRPNALVKKLGLFIAYLKS